MKNFLSFFFPALYGRYYDVPFYHFFFFSFFFLRCKDFLNALFFFFFLFTLSSRLLGIKRVFSFSHVLQPHFALFLMTLTSNVFFLCSCTWPRLIIRKNRGDIFCFKNRVTPFQYNIFIIFYIFQGKKNEYLETKFNSEKC